MAKKEKKYSPIDDYINNYFFTFQFRMPTMLYYNMTIIHRYLLFMMVTEAMKLQLIPPKNYLTTLNVERTIVWAG